MRRALASVPLALLVWAAAASPALGQQRGIARPVWLDRFAGYLELGYELERQERAPPLGGATFEQDEGLLLYGINADLDGGFIHPSILTFDVGGTFRRRSSDIDTSTGLFQGSRTSDASQFRARLNVFPGFRWSGEAAVSQAIQDIDSTFAPQRTIERREILLGAFNKSRVWPFRVTWRRTDTEGIEGDPRDETRDNWLARLDHIGTSSQSSARVELLEFLERSSGQDYEQVGASLSHRWRPGSRREFLLGTTLTGFDRSGTSESKNLLVGQGFNWTPSDTFDLDTALEVREQEDVLGEIRTERASTDLRHLLWGSLTTRAGATYQRTELADEGQERLEEARVDFDYARRLPYGTFTLSWGRRLRTDDRVIAGLATVGSVEAVFDPAVPTLLDTPGLVVATILVTNLAETIVYTEGIDYELIPLNGLVELRVLAGGAISPGDGLLIRFAIEPSDLLEVRTESHRSGIGWRDATGFWVDYNRLRQSQDVLAGTADGRIDQTLDQRATTGYEGRRWRVDA
ncbi:MAG: hypothetical protein OEQ13_04145, partial [Acidobacteriota bacterium]|nr:hypothetical protein [Acidobacteriota bacterium]